MTPLDSGGVTSPVRPLLPVLTSGGRRDTENAGDEVHDVLGQAAEGRELVEHWTRQAQRGSFAHDELLIGRRIETVLRGQRVAPTYMSLIQPVLNR